MHKTRHQHNHMRSLQFFLFQNSCYICVCVLVCSMFILLWWIYAIGIQVKWGSVVEWRDITESDAVGVTSHFVMEFSLIFLKFTKFSLLPSNFWEYSFLFVWISFWKFYISFCLFRECESQNIFDDLWFHTIFLYDLILSPHIKFLKINTREDENKLTTCICSPLLYCNL